MRNNIKTVLIGATILMFLHSFAAYSQGGKQEQLKLAKQYRTGMRKDAGAKKAYQIYSDLALEKSPEALVELGNMYLRGEGTEQNFPAALRCFQDAIDLIKLSAEVI